MRICQLVGILTSLAAAFACLNRRLLKLPSTIALMPQSLVLPLVLRGLLALGVDIPPPGGGLLHPGAGLDRSTSSRCGTGAAEGEMGGPPCS